LHNIIIQAVNHLLCNAFRNTPLRARVNVMFNHHMGGVLRRTPCVCTLCVKLRVKSRSITIVLQNDGSGHIRYYGSLHFPIPFSFRSINDLENKLRKFKGLF